MTSPESQPRTAGPAFGKLFGEIMRDHPSADIRLVNEVMRRAIEAEAAAGPPASAELLIAALSDPDVDHRLHAYSFTKQQQAEAIAATCGSWSLERWYAAFEKVSGLEAKTPEGKRDIFDQFAAEYARLAAEEPHD